MFTDYYTTYDHTNWVAVKEAERGTNESLKHLVVQLYRRDHANYEEMDSTSDGKQEQTTNENRVNVDPSVCVQFILPRTAVAAGIIHLLCIGPNIQPIIGATVKHLSSKEEENQKY